MNDAPSSRSILRPPLTAQPLNVLSLRDQVHQLLRIAILNGKLRTDERLNERQLAGEFGVSTTPVKEALRQLEADGLVEALPRRGIVVKFDKAWAEEMVLARAALEAMVARLAAQRIDGAQTVILMDAIAKMRIATATGTAEELVALNEVFHNAIHDATPGRHLRQLIDRQQVYDTETRRIIHSRPGERELAFAEHAAIATAVTGGNPDAAERAMRDHVLRSGETYLSIIFEGRR